MPMDTIDLHELGRYADTDELTSLFGASNPSRGVLTPEWIGRLSVPLEARGFRVDGHGAPIHFWRNQEQTGFVFAQ